MNAPVDLSFEDFADSNFLPSQYNDLLRRRPPVEAEYRLLWAVLEDAIRTYLVNMDCSTRNRRIAFEKVRDWFRPALHKQTRALFAFQTICEFLEIDPTLLLKGLESAHVNDLSKRRRRAVVRAVRARPLAA